MTDPKQTDAIEAAARVIDPLAFAEQGSRPPRGYECHTPEQLSRTIAARRAHAIRVAERVIAAYLAAQWRPIAEAPKDGSPILVEGGTVEWNAGKHGWFSHSGQTLLQWEPKVFQPLPEPPKEA